MKYQHSQWAKHAIVVSLHVAPPLLAAWASHWWDHGHEVIALPMGLAAIMFALAALARDLWLDEIVEALSPTHLYHGTTAVEPPRPLPAFPEEGPSRVRMRSIERGPYASVAPHDADNETTLEDEVG